MITIAIVIVIIVAIVAAGTMYFENKPTVSAKAVASSGASGTNSAKKAVAPVSPIPNYDLLMENMPKNPMIQDLPSGKTLYFRTFSFSSGQRVWENSFIVEKGTMKEGTMDNPEVTITLHSKYVNYISSSNLCSVLGTANKNKDLGFDSSLGYVSLAWQYSSLMKYKNCFS